MNSIYVDWSETYEHNTWEFVTSNLLRDKYRHCPKCCEKIEEFDNAILKDRKYYCTNCKKSYNEDEANELDGDEGYPMMNYAYPLDVSVDDDKILEVYNRTNCCVVYNNDDNSYYLALTGGGMDLSQDIALAYIIVEGFIPRHLVTEVCLQPCLSVGREDMQLIYDEVGKTLDTIEHIAKRKREELQERIQDFKAKKS